ncbi:COG1669 Predicted nucleotidyltransferases [Fimbriimonadaceae bacterium]
MDVVSERLQLPKLSELCRKYGVVRLSAFGSVVRDDFGERSDVDLVVDFEPVRELTASKQYFGFMFELEDLYGRMVDFVERQGVRNPVFKASLEEQEVNVFAAK